MQKDGHELGDHQNDENVTEFKSRIGEEYLNAPWPDETACLEIAGKTFDRYLDLHSERIQSNESFRIGGCGCGPKGNGKFVRLLVDKLHSRNPEIEVEIIYVEFSCHETQIKICSRIFSDKKNVHVYSSLDSFTAQPFPLESMDVIFGFSSFSYPDVNWMPKSDFQNLFYIHGYDYNEEIEEYSKQTWKELMTSLCSQLKKSGLLIVGEYGVSNTKNEPCYIIQKYFTRMGLDFYQRAKKYNIKTFGVPLLQRNSAAFSEPIEKKLVPMTIFATGNVFDPDAMVKRAHRIGKNPKEIQDVMKGSLISCSKPFIFDEKNAEISQKAFDEHLEDYLNWCVDEEYIADVPGVFFCAIKNN